jgi:phosphoribosylanthranilate isomerase
MPRTRVKICGVTLLEDARYCAGAGADYLGFVQHESSPRYVTPEIAAEIIGWLAGPEPVGVFEDAAPEHVNDICRRAGFRLAQLDGHETPEDCAAIEVPVLKTFRVRHDASTEQLRALMAPYHNAATYFRLDTSETSLWGGPGESFNWRVARELAAEFPLFLSGALTAASVAQAIETMRPFAVDASASLEERPGVKDFDLLADFFEAVRDVAAEE